MPNIFGAGLLDLMSQGGQFLAGRNQQRRQNTIEDEELRQTAAMEEALLARMKAQTEHEAALAQRNLLPNTPNWTYDAERGIQINPQTGEVRTPEGISPRPKAATAPVPGSPKWYEMRKKELDLQHSYDTVPGGAAGASLGTVAQQRAKMLYTAGKGGYDTLESTLAESGKDAPGWLEQQGSKLPMGLGNMATTPFMRQMQQGANQLSDSWLRLTSGAAVPETEVARFAAGFLPLAGDDPGTAENKKQARAIIVEAMRAAANADMNAVDVQEGLRAAGISPTDPAAVAAWIQANAQGGAPGGTVAPAPTNPFEQRRIERQGGVR